jgi:type II secretory pathway pseudopilin PulG
MKRKLISGLFALVALAILLSFAFPIVTTRTAWRKIGLAESYTRQVAFVLKAYADDHQGRLPQSLDELIPNYLPNTKLLEHTHLTAPHVVLAQLSPDSIILFQVVTDDFPKVTRVIVAHPDCTVEQKQP